MTSPPPSVYLTVLGTVNPDLVLRVPRLPVADESVPVLESYRTRGGTASNLVQGVASLGVPTRLVGETGSDFLERFGPELEVAGVDLTHLAPVEPAPLCHVLLADDGEQAYLMDRGGVVDWADRLDPRTVETLADTTEVLHLGTGHPGYYLKLVEALEGLSERKGPLLTLDPSQDLAYHYDEATLRQLLPHAGLLFCSAFELGLLRRLLGLPDGDRGAAGVLQSLGPKTVVLTRGGEGSAIYHGSETILVPAIPPCQKGSPTGAGDGFRAGFYAARHMGLDLAEQGLAGAATASLVLESRAPVAEALDWESVALRMEWPKS